MLQRNVTATYGSGPYELFSSTTTLQDLPACVIRRYRTAASRRAIDSARAMSTLDLIGTSPVGGRNRHPRSART
jgi:hypothetical protein